MLVYANNLTIEGEDASECVFKAVGAWTKEQLGYGLRPNQIKERGEYNGTKNNLSSWLRINSTDDEFPALYSWTLKVADKEVRGRQWITELGLKVQQDHSFFSCVLRTDEHSTLISEEVQASQPRVIRYLIENVIASNNATLSGYVPGISAYQFGHSPETYQILLEEIKNNKRNFPIVIISPDADGNYLIEPDALQKKLVGLAQVIQISPEYNSYEMEEVLGRHWSAWNGAINIIQMPSPKGFIKGRIFMSDEIESWGSRPASRIGKVLAWVTHNTNIPRLRDRVRPEGVAQLALRRALKQSRDRASNMNVEELRKELETVWELADEQSQEINEHERQIRSLEEDLLDKELKIQEATDDLRTKDFSIQSLRYQLNQSGRDQSISVDIDTLMEMAVKLDQPSPKDCLEFIRIGCSDKCVVLPSAIASAEESAQFSNGQRLLRALYMLVTEFRSKLMSGGDAQARSVFTRNEYAATESETVTSNPELSRKRTFEYNGKPITMFRHLKIGVDSDVSNTIRVHFAWDVEAEKIIIGYCGEHLPITAR